MWLAAGSFLRIARSQNLVHYALLGIVLALAYFTKVVALSLAAAALGLLLFTGPSRKKAIVGSALYAAILVVLVTPYVVRLSAAKGRLTFGDSGSLNYAWVVDGAYRWELEPDSPLGHARLGKLVHPARRVLDAPPVYEFATPVPGTFPIFNDPSYWDDGLKPVFYLKGELWHIAMDLYHTGVWLARRGEFVLAFILLAVLMGRSHIRWSLREMLPVLLLLLGLWGLYVMVDVEDRYVFADLTAVLMIAAAAVRLPESRYMRAIVAVCLLILVGGVAIRTLNAACEKVYLGVKLATVGMGPNKNDSVGPYDNPYWKVAQTLDSRLGLHANDSVACLELGCENTFWAYLAGVRITSDIPKGYQYWGAGPQDRARAMDAMAGVGAKALVARNLGPGSESEGWIPLGEELYARPVRPEPQTASREERPVQAAKETQIQ